MAPDKKANVVLYFYVAASSSFDSKMKETQPEDNFDKIALVREVQSQILARVSLFCRL